MRRQSKLPEISGSSVFELHRHHPAPPTKDRGASVISLSDAPSLVRKGPKHQYENTFKIEPDNRIDFLKIKDIVNNTLVDIFQDAKYNYEEMGHLCKRTSQVIKDSVKMLKIERYKIICSVTISEQTGQGVKKASRFLWDDKKDNWVDAYFANSSLVAHASVYALYFE